jgi:phosphoserine phosphatase
MVAFDLDGTLAPNTTVSLHLGPWIGNHDIEELERLYDLGRITTTEFAERDAAFYRNRHRYEVWRQLDQLPLIAGVNETLTWLKDRRLVPIVATVTMSLAAEYLCDRFGFAAGSGCELAETADGMLLGKIARHFSAEDKPIFVQRVAQEHGLGLEDVLAIGDSTSDLPLFRSVGFSIALNASADARAFADVEVDTDDLRHLIPMIERHFVARAEERARHENV